jgi:hypothetical protein
LKQSGITNSYVEIFSPFSKRHTKNTPQFDALSVVSGIYNVLSNAYSYSGKLSAKITYQKPTSRPASGMTSAELTTNLG